MPFIVKLTPRLLPALLAGVMFCASGSALASTEGASPQTAMLGWVNSMSIVEQLQTIHRIEHQPSRDSMMMLVDALQSPYPLARRKASRTLLDAVSHMDGSTQTLLLNQLGQAMYSTDPVVQKNMVRMVADLNVPEAQTFLKAFFSGSDKQLQINGVEALLFDAASHMPALELAKQTSPFDEVRRTVAERIEP